MSTEAQHLEIQAALDDGAFARRAANRAQDGERRSGGNATSSRDHDYRDSGPRVTRDQKRQRRAAQGEIDQVTRQAIRRALNRRSGTLGSLHGLDDASKGRVAADLLRTDFQHARLVDGSRKYRRARDLFDRHGLAGNRRLVDEGVPAGDNAVHRNSTAGSHQHHVADLHFGKTSRGNLARRSHLGSLRQQVQQFADRASAASHRHPFQNFGDQHEDRDEQGREELADDRGGYQRDGHGKFHGHAPFQQIGDRLFEDGIAADQDAYQREDVDSAHARNQLRPHENENDGNKRYPRPFEPAFVVIMMILVIIVMLLPMVVVVWMVLGVRGGCSAGLSNASIFRIRIRQTQVRHFPLLASSPQVSSQNVDQLLRGSGLFGCRIVVGIHDMESYVPVQDLRHQGIERAPACGNRVQDFRAVSLSLDRMLDGLNLPAYAADAIEHFLLVPNDVCQKPPPEIYE